jgi:hypothetical protein
MLVRRKGSFAFWYGGYVIAKVGHARNLALRNLFFGVQVIGIVPSAMGLLWGFLFHGLKIRKRGDRPLVTPLVTPHHEPYRIST